MHRVCAGIVCQPGLELAQHHHSAGALVLVQNHQLNSFVRTGLPSFVFGQHDVGFASAATKPRTVIWK